MTSALARLHADLVRCRRCPRLVAHREAVAASPPRRHRGETYWARPIPGFGDPRARIVLVGLAPGAHGANRTGRMFTGDSSGSFLYPALFRAGLASRPDAVRADDGLRLKDVYIVAAARCAPPDNKPVPSEIENCRPWLEAEVGLLKRVRVYLALGRIGHDAILRFLGQRPARWPFAHGALHNVPGDVPVLDTYHVSRQNTNTGKLTKEMFDAVLREAKRLAIQPVG